MKPAQLQKKHIFHFVEIEPSYVRALPKPLAGLSLS
jgi:hypothetical protein